MDLTQRWAAFLYTHPRARRVWLLYCTTWSASIMAIATAPRASAAIMADVVSWTGLHDSYQVPIGQHFVSLVPVLEAIREQAPKVTPDPTTWPTAIGHWAGTWITYQQLGMVLNVEGTGLCAMVAVTVWIVGFALTAIWLGWLAALARPLLAQMGAVAHQMYLAPFSLLAAIAVGAIAARRDGYGRGVGIIVGGAAVIGAGWLMLGHPADDVLGDNGILGVARTAAFGVSEGIAHNGALAGGGTQSQLDALQTGLVDVLVRRPIEQVNFSEVIDNIGKCGTLYSQKLLTGLSAEPAHSMATCDPSGSALTAARSLDATVVAAFALVIFLISLICAALNFVSMESFAIGAQAFWNVLILPYAVTVAAPPGPTREYGKGRVSEVFKLGVQYFIAGVGVGVLVVMMYNASSPWVARTINMSHPIAQLTSMVMLALAGAIGFFFLLRSFGRRTVAGMVWGATGAKAWQAVTGRQGRDKASDAERKRKNIDDLVEQRRRDNEQRRNRTSDEATESDLPARRPLADVATEQESIAARPRISPAQAKTAADAAAAGGAARSAATALLERPEHGTDGRDGGVSEPARVSAARSSAAPSQDRAQPPRAGRSRPARDNKPRQGQTPPARPDASTIDSLPGADPDEHPGRRTRPPTSGT